MVSMPHITCSRLMDWSLLKCIVQPIQMQFNKDKSINLLHANVRQRNHFWCFLYVTALLHVIYHGFLTFTWHPH